MFDTKTLTKLKSIDVGEARPDGIVFDAFSERVFVFSHPTKNATVIDARDGTVQGTIDLGGTPEQGVPDGKGMLYVVMQDPVGSVTVVDLKSMKAVAHYSLVDMGGCNGLALDAKNGVLFAACSRPSPALGQASGAGQPGGQSQAAQSQAAMVVLSAKDGKILAKLPLAGNSDGAAFNPATMEAFSTGGNGTLTVVKEKDSHELRSRAGTDHDERSSHDYARYEDRPSVHDVARAHTCARGGAGSAEWPSCNGTASAWLVHDPDDRKVGRRNAFRAARLGRMQAEPGLGSGACSRWRYSANVEIGERRDY